MLASQCNKCILCCSRSMLPQGARITVCQSSRVVPGPRSPFKFWEGHPTEIESHRAWRNAFPSSTKRTAHQRRQIDRNSFARMEIVTTSCIADMGFCAKKISLGGLRGNFSRYIFMLSHDSASQDTKEPSLFRPYSSDPRRALQSEARSHPMVEEPQQAAE